MGGGRDAPGRDGDRGGARKRRDAGVPRKPLCSTVPVSRRIVDETTPIRPTSRKGEIRAAIEARLHAAADRGVRVIILRSGDFFGGPGIGSYFDRILIRDIAAGRLTYPGPLDVVHEWAYVPDLCEAMRRLVEARAGLEPFAQFGFPGHAVTGRVLVGAIARACGRGFKVSGMPWTLLRMLGIVVPIFRELSEMAYLWSTPHAIDGTRLAAVIGDIPHTPLDRAVASALLRARHQAPAGSRAMRRATTSGASDAIYLPPNRPSGVPSSVAGASAASHVLTSAADLGGLNR